MAYWLYIFLSSTYLPFFAPTFKNFCTCYTFPIPPLLHKPIFIFVCLPFKRKLEIKIYVCYYPALSIQQVTESKIPWSKITASWTDLNSEILAKLTFHFVERKLASCRYFVLTEFNMKITLRDLLFT